MHPCHTGARREGVNTYRVHTQAFAGCFETAPALRAEFLHALGGQAR